MSSQNFTAPMPKPQRLTATFTPRAVSQSPWTSDIDGADYNLTNVQTITTNGDIDCGGDYLRNGVPLAITNQGVVTGSRASNTVYQNTTGKTMFIMTCWDLGGKSSTLTALADANDPPSTTIAQVSDASNQATTIELFFMVLVNHFYECQVTSGTPALVSWVEYT